MLSQIQYQIEHLKLPQNSENEKIDALIQLINLTVNSDINDWNGVATTYQIVNDISEMMINTSNQNISILCSTILEIIQQHGTEAEEKIDSKIILSPLISLLFNKDDNLSEIGKRSLLKAIDKNAEIIHELVEFNLFDQASEQLNISFPPSEQAESQYHCTSSSNGSVEQKVLLNILEVVDKVIHANIYTIQNTKRIKNSIERIAQQNLPIQISTIIKYILSSLDDQNQDQDNEILDERTKICELEKKVQQSEERVQIAQLKQKQAEESQIRATEKAQLAEQDKSIEKQRADSAEQEIEKEKNRADSSQALISCLSEQIARLSAQLALKGSSSTETSSGQSQSQSSSNLLIQKSKTKQVNIFNRKPSVISLITPIFILSKASQGKVKKNRFIHPNEFANCTIALDPVIRDGIVYIEIVFDNAEGYAKAIGIADSSCQFAADTGASQHKQQTVRYYWSGDLDHITDELKGNQGYKDGHRIGAEVDMTIVPRRVTFFVNDIEQTNHVIGIPEAIRFWAFIFKTSSSFTVNKFERLEFSLAKGVVGSKASEWGKKWK
ncbi:MAG: hypothetical protein EZS28_012063 [Streblomastix strix]|uniref:Uncharacterized protein n=1 Tax=Streblomastix strix TaxID=222440 RepID=A0A5J4WC61_9EUKA|nr:MAG: hypothetical protein EZS28_012063 [Streblomastix strix]